MLNGGEKPRPATGTFGLVPHGELPEDRRLETRRPYHYAGSGLSKSGRLRRQDEATGGS